MTTTVDVYAGYERVQEQRSALQALIAELDDLAVQLTLTQWRERLRKTATKVGTDTFKVLIVGEFKRGKSTLINALLGQKVLPAHALPTTAIVNELKWGHPPSARLHFRAEEDGTRRQPLDISVDDLARHVVIDRTNRNAPSRYERAEVFWDLELCRHGVEVIDSPGLNENEIREQTTLDYLPEVDATIFVILATQALSDHELAYLRHHVQPASAATFFVFNRINDVDAEEREDVRDDLSQRIAEYAADTDGRVFFVNAKGALDGRVVRDEERVADSGVPELERALHDFLARDRARVKLQGPLLVLDEGVRSVRAEIPRARALLAESLEALELRYEREQGPLKDLELRRHNTIATLNNHIAELAGEVTIAAERFYVATADRMPGWTEHETVNRLTNNPFKTKEQAAAVCEEMGEHLGGQVRDAFDEWRRSKEFVGLVDSRVAAMLADLDRDVQEFAAQIAAIRDGLAHDSTVAGQAMPELASDTERVIAGTLGLLLPGSAVSGATLGMDAMLKTILPQLAVFGAGLVLLGPGIGLVAVLGGSAFVQSLVQLESANQKIKSKVGDAVAQDLRDNAHARGERIGKTAAGKLVVMRDELDAGLAGEIQALRDQVEAVLADKRKGEAHVAERNRTLDAALDDLDHIERRVADLRQVVDLA